MVAPVSGGGFKLSSHSFMKFDALFFRLLGVSRFRTVYGSSSSFGGDDGVSTGSGDDFVLLLDQRLVSLL